jgi:hypothetical protein
MYIVSLFRVQMIITGVSFRIMIILPICRRIRKKGLNEKEELEEMDRSSKLKS